MPLATARPLPRWRTGSERFVERLRRALGTEFGSLHPRLVLVDLVVRLLPQLAFPYLRTALYRRAGVSIGARSLLSGRLQLIGPGAIEHRLKIGEHCWLNAPLFADLTDDITIGDRVSIGHHVVLVTTNHEEGPFSQRAGRVDSAPIVIGDGTWIAAGVTILPGVTIGAGSIVGAGSLVTCDVPPRTLALGRPARAVRRLGGDERPQSDSGPGKTAPVLEAEPFVRGEARAGAVPRAEGPLPGLVMRVPHR